MNQRSRLSSGSRLEEYLPLRGRWLRYFFQGIQACLWMMGVTYVFAVLCGPRTFSQTKKGQRGAAISQIANFKTAIELYRVDYDGKCPPDLDRLIRAPSAALAGKPVRWKGPYLNEVTTIPADPWGSPYVYEVPGREGEPYEIISYGEDGREGGAGDAEDSSSSKR